LTLKDKDKDQELEFRDRNQGLLTSYTGDGQVTLSKPKLFIIGPCGNYYGFCCKAIQLQTSQVIETVFSTNWSGFENL